MPEQQLFSELVRRGVVLGEDPDLELLNALDEAEVPVMLLADDRWAFLPAVLEGRTFTHRLTEADVTYDLLQVFPDLAGVVWVTDYAQYSQLADDSPVSLLYPDAYDDIADEREIPLNAIDEGGALLLPAGYFAGRRLKAGELIAIGLGGGRLTLEPAPEPVLSAGAMEALRQRLSALFDTSSGEPDDPIELDIAIRTVCADDSTLFTALLPPLAEALEECGFAHQGEHLAPSGFDFGAWRAEIEVADIAERYDLDDDEALAVLAIVTLYEQVAKLFGAAKIARDEGGEAALDDLMVELTHPGESSASADLPTRAVVADLVPLLAEPAVAMAVLAETVEVGGGSAGALGVFAESLEEQAPRKARPALAWLQGNAHERLGNVAAAEAAYLRAEQLDPAWEPALVDLARFASDRGDVVRGLSLLRRAGAESEHNLMALLERFESQPRRGMGRNQPCWCGSGQKYKKCHLGNEQLPLEERAVWLYQKAATFVDKFWRGAMIEAALARAAHSDAQNALLGALLDPLVADVVLFEGGAFHEFVTKRGGLLPDDERSLAEQWLLIERSVYEVAEVRPGAGLTLRDVRTGDVQPVRERTASRSLQAGALICAHVLPAGDTTQIFGGIEPIRLHERDELIALLDAEPDPLDVVEFLTRRFAPVGLANTEGEPMVRCEAVLRTETPADLATKLDEVYDAVDDERRVWHETVITQGVERIRATIRLAGHNVNVEANSEARFDRVLDTLRNLDPTLTLQEQSRDPARNEREVSALLAKKPASRPLARNDPEAAALLDQVIREYERNWLDESIPALAGRTPREAAADPTRRGDLIRLLDSFPHDPNNPGMMNVHRLRAALDLD